MDQLSYTYNDATNNRLNRVADAMGTTQGDDFGGSSSYEYDAIGNLVHDEQEEIESIEWTVTGKVRKVTRTTGSTKPNLEFYYDAMGNRVGKLVTTPGQPDQKTIYTLDASGQLMATYSVSNTLEYANGAASATLLELPLYGSQRLGSFNANVEVAHHEMGTSQKIPFWGTFRELGSKYYELTNHLGNVLVVVTDRKIATPQDGTFSHYSADVVSVTDYYPFGMQMPGRMMNTGEYRYGFNGQEKDDEMAGEGNSNTAMYWQYDTRLGRRWNTDPVVKDWESPYACFANNPVCITDVDGNDSIWITGTNNSYMLLYWGKGTTTTKYDLSQLNTGAMDYVIPDEMLDIGQNKINLDDFFATVPDAVGIDISAGGNIGFVAGGGGINIIWHTRSIDVGAIPEVYIYEDGGVQTGSDNAGVGVSVSFIAAWAKTYKGGKYYSASKEYVANGVNWTGEFNVINGSFTVGKAWGKVDVSIVGSKFSGIPFNSKPKDGQSYWSGYTIGIGASASVKSPTKAKGLSDIIKVMNSSTMGVHQQYYYLIYGNKGDKLKNGQSVSGWNIWNPIDPTDNK